MKTNKILTLATALLVSALSVKAQVTSFSDINYWVGSGTNQSVLVIDWKDGKAPQSIAWGYQWNGSTTKENMLTDIVAADTKLYMNASPSGFGLALYGLGYDVNGGGFATTAGTSFDLQGIAMGPFNGYPANSTQSLTNLSVDAMDHYKQGWTYSVNPADGYWTDLVGVGNPFSGGLWQQGFGLSSSVTDGQWQALTFDVGFANFFAAFPTAAPGTYPITGTIAAPSPVPEPSTYLMIISGLFVLTYVVTQSRKNKKSITQ
ncbi:MAG: hypothetical protein SGI98_09350 [Verrucomicrobiota bacterium]|nr:hypothetical protein [Verrucomicrobiota bacterium]